MEILLDIGKIIIMTAELFFKAYLVVDNLLTQIESIQNAIYASIIGVPVIVIVAIKKGYNLLQKLNIL